MQGSNNRIIVNQATMREAMQYWLSSQYMAGKVPKVTLVNKDTSTGNFEITCDAPDPVKTNKFTGVGPRADDC